MKILMANKFHYLQGGAERHYFDLGELLEKRGHEVIPFAMSDERNRSSRYSKYFVSNVDLSDPSQTQSKLKAAERVVYSLEAKKKMGALADKVKPDIAHLHNIYHQLSPSILPALKKRGIPVVLTAHDFKLMCPAYLFYSRGEVCERCKKHKYYNCLRRRCVKSSGWASATNMIEMYVHWLSGIYKNNIDKIICPSKFIYDKLVEFGFSPDQLVVLPHFIDCQSVEPIYGGEYVLYFGRLSKEKGVGTLLQAFSRVKDVQLKIAGQGPYEKELRSQKKRLGLNHVEFTGFLQGGDLKRAIEGAALVVVPSESYETFGLSALETFAAGKPVVASRLGALSEIIKDGENGYLFEPGDANDLAARITQIMSESGRSEEMGKKARRFVQRDYTPDKYYEALMEVYREFLG